MYIILLYLIFHMGCFSPVILMNILKFPYVKKSIQHIPGCEGLKTITKNNHKTIDYNIPGVGYSKGD